MQWPRRHTRVADTVTFRRLREGCIGVQKHPCFDCAVGFFDPRKAGRNKLNRGKASRGDGGHRLGCQECVGISDHGIYGPKR